VIRKASINHATYRRKVGIPLYQRDSIFPKHEKPKTSVQAGSPGKETVYRTVPAYRRVLACGYTAVEEKKH